MKNPLIDYQSINGFENKLNFEIKTTSNPKK